MMPATSPSAVKVQAALGERFTVLELTRARALRPMPPLRSAVA
jgi:hypothetical protein